MENKINEELTKIRFTSQDELKRYTSSVQMLIQDYEQYLYEMNNYDKFEQNKIKQWRNKLYQIIQENKDIPERMENFDELEGTVKVIHRQVKKADINQQLLDKSTLKLMGLNYTSGDVEKALIDTKKKIKENQKKERNEIFLIMIAFIIFIFVCFLILFDKFVSRK